VVHQPRNLNLAHSYFADFGDKNNLLYMTTFCYIGF
jgi:hypothetical protein